MTAVAYFDRAMEHLAGTCMMNLEQALNETLKYAGYPREATQDEVDAFANFLDENECWECDTCGWWGHPGEELQGTCSDCEAYEDLPE